MIKKVCYIFIFSIIFISQSYAQIANDTPWDTSTNSVEPVDTMLYEAVEEEAYEDGNYDENDTPTNTLFEHRKIADADWDKIKKDSAFVYKKENVDKKKIETTKPVFDGLAKFLSSGFFRFLMFAIVGIILIMIIYFLLKYGNINLNAFSRKKRIITELQPMEHVREFTAWEKELQVALAIPDYRKAIRIHYLNILNLLDEKHLIQYKEDKTNWEYVHELKNFSDVKDFIQLTKYFDYIWYGEFDLNLETYTMLSSQFELFKQKIR